MLDNNLLRTPTKQQNLAVVLATPADGNISASARQHHSPLATDLQLTDGEQNFNEELQRVIHHQDAAREYLPRLFRNDPSLIELDLSSTMCSDVALLALTDGLKVSTHIKVLLLDGNDITDEGAKLLGDALKVNHSLTRLSLKSNHVGTVGAQHLIAALEVNDELTECAMDDNAMIAETEQSELDILTKLNLKPRSLKKIVLQLKRDTAPAFVNLSRAETARAEHRELRHEAREHLDDWTAQVLALYMANNQSVQHLDLSFHHISDVGAFHLSRMLMQNRHLDKLNLQGNAITTIGVDYFIEALKVNVSCRYICLLKNLVSQEHIIRLEWATVLNRQPLTLKPMIAAMQDNDPALAEVKLDVSASHRYFDDVSARLVSDSLRYNNVVTSLQLTNSKITSVGAQFLADLLNFNETLQVVDFSYNPLRDGVVAIAKSLTLNRSIKQLLLRSTAMNDVGATALAEMLKENHCLEELVVSENPEVTVVSGRNFIKALNHNTTLMNLEMVGTSVDPSTLDDLQDRKRLNQEPLAVRETISQLFSATAPCKKVDLCGNTLPKKLQDNSLRLIAEGVEANSTATIIDVSHNSISVIGVASLVMALTENRTTTVKLNLSYNPIKDPIELARMMARILSTHQTLQVINLSGLGLNDEAVDRIAHILDSEQSFPIREITLNDNPDVSDDCAFNLYALIALNGLQVRLKDTIRPLWTVWKRCQSERRPFPHTHLNFRKYSPVVDLTMANEQERIDNGVLLVCQMLRRIEGVTSIDYSENEVSDVGAAHFANLFMDRTSKSCIVQATLSRNQFTDVGALALKNAAEHCLALRHVNIDGNLGVSESAREGLYRSVLYNCQPVDVQALLVRISNNDPSLTSLDMTTLTGNQLDDSQVKLATEGLRRNTHLTNVDLSHGHISWVSLGPLLETITQRMPELQLERLYLRNLMLCEDDSIALCTALRDLLVRNQAMATAAGEDTSASFHPIKSIDISCNVIRSLDLPLLLEGTHVHRFLDHFGAVSTGLNETEMLRIHLNVQKNHKSHDAGVVERDVLAIVKANSDSVTEVAFVDGELNNILAQDVCEALNANEFITAVDMSNNELSDDAIAACFRILASNCSVKELKFCKNHAAAKSVEALLAMLQANNCLQILDLRWNPQLPLTSLELLCSNVLASNTTIVRIDISDEEELRQHSNCIEEGEANGKQTHRSAQRSDSQVSIISGANFSSTSVSSALPDDECSTSTPSSSSTTIPSSLSTVKRFLKEQLSINQQPTIRNALVAARLNDPQLVTISAHSDGPSTLHNDIGCECIAEALLYNTHVTTLDLSDGLITDRGCKALARCLMVNRSVTMLLLSRNNIGEKGIIALSHVLQVNSVLSSIDISGSKRRIAPETLECLRRALVENDTLRTMNVVVAAPSIPTSADSTSRKSLSAGSRRNTSRPASSRDKYAEELKPFMSRLELMATLNNRHLSIKHFIKQNNEFLKSDLDCSNAAAQGRIFDRRACEFMCKVLAADNVVTTVNLSNNALDAASGQLLSDLLIHNRSITSLDLSWNSIEDGAMALHDALLQNNSVIHLALDHNNCSPHTLDKINLLLLLNKEHVAFKEEILRIFEKNEDHTLCQVQVPDLGLEDNQYLPGFANRKRQLDDESVDIISNVLRADLIIRDIDLSWNAITDSGLHTLLLLVKRNKGIRSLRLSHNLLTDESVKLLTEMMPFMPSLVEIDFSYNSVTPEVTPLIVDIFRKYPAVQTVSVQGNRLPPKNLDAIEFFSRLNRYCSNDLRLLLTNIFDNVPTCVDVDMNSFYSFGNWNHDGSTMQLLTFALLGNTHVTSLSLEFNDINDKQFLVLCNMLRLNSTIRSINLSNNLIESLEPLLAENFFHIERLFLRKNRLGMASAIDLSKVLPHNETLMELDVSWNLWGRAGVSIIKGSLPMNVALTNIEVEGEGIQQELVEQTKFATTLNYRNVPLSFT